MANRDMLKVATKTIGLFLDGAAPSFAPGANSKTLILDATPEGRSLSVKFILPIIRERNAKCICVAPRAESPLPVAAKPPDGKRVGAHRRIDMQNRSARGTDAPAKFGLFAGGGLPAGIAAQGGGWALGPYVDHPRA
jgi:hypothetical protein